MGEDPAAISRAGRLGRRSNGHAFAADLSAREGARGSKPVARPATPVLSPDKSASLWDRRVAELDGLLSADVAASWAHRRLPRQELAAPPNAALVKVRFPAEARGFWR
jgi:hypothetical protein